MEATDRILTVLKVNRARSQPVLSSALQEQETPTLARLQQEIIEPQNSFQHLRDEQLSALSTKVAELEQNQRYVMDSMGFEDLLKTVQQQLEESQKERAKLKREVAALQFAVEEQKTLLSKTSNLVQDLAKHEAYLPVPLAASNDNLPTASSNEKVVLRAEKSEDNCPNQQVNDISAESMPQEGLEDTFCWGESVWEACFLIWRKELGIFPSLCLMMATGVSILMQGYFCKVVLTDFWFDNTDRFDELLPGLRNWRATEGHHYKHLATEETSLAARVCGIDSSLSLAGRQMALLEEINLYFSMDKFDLESNGIPTGPGLCLMCIAFFTLHVVKELRQVILFSWSLCNLPHNKTKLLKDTIVAVSYSRLAITLATCVIRIVVATILLISGVFWLASTSSTLDLILNAAALSIVMEIDEILLVTLTPERAIQLVARVQSLKVPRIPYFADGLFKLFFFITVMILAYGLCLKPNMRDMLRIKRELCGGNVDFVIDESNLGALVSVDTRPFEEPVMDTTDSWSKAVLEMKTNRPALTVLINWWNWSDSSESAKWSVLAGDRISFEDMSTMTVLGWAEGWPICSNSDLFSGLFNFLPLHNQIRSAVGWSSTSLDEQEGFKCDNFLAYCNNVELYLLRLMCPVTCGCHDYSSGIALPETRLGCPLLCTQSADLKFESMPCMDVDLTSDVAQASWTRYWRGFELRESVRRPQSILQPYVSSMISKGCDLQTLDAYSDTIIGMLRIGSRHPCWDDVDKEMEIPLVAFCPATCCNAFWDGCPKNCSLR